MDSDLKGIVDYQWQEYLDSSLPDRNGWEPTCSTAPATDTPAASGCTSRFLPRGRPVRRRRLFPPPLNHYARGVRPQWSTPYYDCGQKWNREQPGVKFCSSPHSNCCDHDSQIDKTSTDKYSRASVKKNRKCRGSLHQPKSTSVAKNCDHSYPGNNKSDWADNAYRNEYFSPSEELPKGHLNLLETSPMSVSESSVYSPIDTASQHYQELSCVSLSPNCCSKSRLRDFPQENSRTPFKSPNQDFYSDNGKEDKLSSIIRTTIFEAQEESVSSSCQANQNILLEDGSNNSNSGLRQIACEEFYNYCENSPASVQVCYDTSQNTLQDSSKKESSLNDIAVNFTNNIEQETDLYNLMQATDTVEQLATTNPVLKFEEQTNCDENIKQSVVIYDPQKPHNVLKDQFPAFLKEQ
ncbi:uncharacterized protein CEXT_761561 [Caerostris extrusa]|uniref:Uncharacterized protein n=1 Tax=Caerostris extrusa TaxID=172846 RepID=A0AAV4UI61_CAEEX|nr:uncharacterized protein CEXT_761561 [Caerostris extrusa]